MEKWSKVVYGIPCSCGKACIGETKKRCETRLKDHREACQRGMLQNSAVAKHAWKDHHSIRSEQATVVAMDKHPGELPLEALHINMTPDMEHLNKDNGLEIPGC